MKRTKGGSFRFSCALSVLAILIASACSSTRKKENEPELSVLKGKKVALVTIEGEPTSRKVVEVALINQLLEKGTFVVISKREIEEARLAPHQDPTDWEGIAKRAGADFALQAKVLQFDAIQHEGYSEEEVLDSQLAEEQGTDGKTHRIYKAKSLEGQVRVQLEFRDVQTHQTQMGLAEAKDRFEANAKTSSIHLPPKLRFLENLSNKAFREFFERYN